MPAATAALKAPAANTLTGTVGPGFTISSLRTGAGEEAEGRQVHVKIADKAIDHNFHLKGPGVNKKTSVAAKINTTWNVTLEKGKYTYVCDPHLTFMKGSFTVS